MVPGHKTFENRVWEPKFSLPFQLLIQGGAGNDSEYDGRWYQAFSKRDILGAVEVVGYPHPDNGLAVALGEDRVILLTDFTHHSRKLVPR
jgi:hypothetical protein